MDPPVPGTTIAAFVTEAPWMMRVYYHMPDGGTNENICGTDGKWTQRCLDISFGMPKVGSAELSVISWNGGREIRLYYLQHGRSDNWVVDEMVSTDGNGWRGGTMGEFEVDMDARLRMTATLGTKNAAPPFYTRVYLQDKKTNIIAELTNESGSWRATKLPIAEAIEDTSLAAVSYTSNGKSNIRLYYQAEDLSLKEYRHDGEKWFPGEFNPGKTTAGAHIAALVLNNGEIQVYWRDLDSRVVCIKNTGSWESTPTVIEKAEPGYKFGVVQWNDGESIRLFNQGIFDQDTGGDIVELCSDDRGKTWVTGKVWEGMR